jgi:uncharacterized surface protein with fasciclin (FAS1) repeats
MQTRRIVLRGIGVAGVLGVAGVGSASARPPSEGDTLVDVAIAQNASGPFAGDLDTLIAAVLEAELDGVLSGNRQLTVFAPTDETFDNTGITAESGGLVVDPATAQLLEDAGLSLADVLRYHVVPGLRDARSILPVSGVPTLSRARVDVDGVTLNDGQASIVATDIPASNGIVHVIEGDSVLLP